MDEIVKQAMAKWPNVPHCYGWLGLDARGSWRMRNEQIQNLQLPGDKITNPALINFINRNYLCDDRGCWYFQNGPQRVYVNLEATPYIAHTDPTHGFALHIGAPLPHIDQVWMTESGQLLLAWDRQVAQLDDRDVAECLTNLHIGAKIINDEQLTQWLHRPDSESNLTLHLPRHASVPVRHIASTTISAHFHFVRTPF